MRQSRVDAQTGPADRHVAQLRRPRGEPSAQGVRGSLSLHTCTAAPSRFGALRFVGMPIAQHSFFPRSFDCTDRVSARCGAFSAAPFLFVSSSLQASQGTGRHATCMGIVLCAYHNHFRAEPLKGHTIEAGRLATSAPRAGRASIVTHIRRIPRPAITIEWGTHGVAPKVPAARAAPLRQRGGRGALHGNWTARACWWRPCHGSSR